MAEQQFDLQYFRKRIPVLASMADDEAIDAIHGAYYPSANRDDLVRSLGVVRSATPAQSTQPSLDTKQSASVEASQQDGVDGAFARGWENMSNSVGITGDLSMGDYAAAAQRVAQGARYNQQNPGSPELQDLGAAWRRGEGISGGITEVGREFGKDWRAAKGPMAKALSFGKNLAALGEGVVEQVPNMLPSMGGMATGAGAGFLTPVPGGTIGGAFVGGAAGNAAVEGGGMVMDALQQAGIDPNDTAKVQAFLEQNGTALLGKSALKGAVISAVDLATMKLGSFVLSAPGKAAAAKALADMGVDVTNKAAVKAASQSAEFAQRIATDATYQAWSTGAGKLARNATSAALAPTGEFLGEYLGTGLSTGVWDEKNAALEAFSSIGQSSATFGGQKALQAATNPLKGLANRVRQSERQAGSGPMSAAVNSGVEAKAQRIEDGALTFTQAQVLEFAKDRLNELDLKANGSADGSANGSTQESADLNDKPQFLSEQERQEFDALSKNIDNAKALADLYGVEIVSDESQVETLGAVPVAPAASTVPPMQEAHEPVDSDVPQGSTESFDPNSVTSSQTAPTPTQPPLQESLTNTPMGELLSAPVDPLVGMAPREKQVSESNVVAGDAASAAIEIDPETGEILNAPELTTDAQPEQTTGQTPDSSPDPVLNERTAQEGVEGGKVKSERRPTAELEAAPPDESEAADAPKTEPNFDAAKALLQAQKDATGDKRAEAAVKRKLRDLAKKTPSDHAKTVLALDMAATRLGLGEGNSAPLEFAPAQEASKAPQTEQISEQQKSDPGNAPMNEPGVGDVKAETAPDLPPDAEAITRRFFEDRRAVSQINADAEVVHKKIIADEKASAPVDLDAINALDHNTAKEAKSKYQNYRIRKFGKGLIDNEVMLSLKARIEAIKPDYGILMRLSEEKLGHPPGKSYRDLVEQAEAIKQAQSAADEVAKQEAAKSAKTFPQFVLAMGLKPSEVKRGTAQYRELKDAFDAQREIAKKGEAQKAKTPPQQPKAPADAMQKLKNTGADLRRFWEQLRSDEKANRSSAAMAWDKINAATQRAAVFSPMAGEGATPGVHRFFDAVRASLPTFADVLKNGSRDIFSHRPRKKNKYSKWLINQLEDAGVADSVMDTASSYVQQAAALADHLSGASTVQEAIAKLDEVFTPAKERRGYFRGLPTITDKGVTLGVGKDSQTSHLLDEGLRDHGALNDYLTDGFHANKLLESENTVDDPNAKKRMVRTRIDQVVRDMPKLVRTGDVTPDQFKTEFGLADVGFGNWVAKGRDQRHLNAAWDAFADLAERIGVQRKAIGFFGRMHLTIGALGHGKHAAHFSPNQPAPDGTKVPVINVTNTKGDGTLAHEWGHALDYLVMRESAEGKRVMNRVLAVLKKSFDLTDAENAINDGLKGRRWMTQFAISGPKGSVQNVQALVSYHAYTKSTPTKFKADADSLGKGYWGSDVELFARAWEAFIFDTLQGSNNYLVSDWVKDGHVTKDAGYNGTPYPVGEERELFNGVFTAVLKSMSDKDGQIIFNYDAFDAALPDEIRTFKSRAQALIDSVPERKKAFDAQKAKEAEDRRQADIAQAQAKAMEAQEAIEADLKARRERHAQQAAELEKDRVNGFVKQTASPNQPLSDADLNALFDQALNEVESRNAERPRITPNVPESNLPKKDGEASASPVTKHQAPPKVTDLVREAAKQGVTGIDETLNALSQLFGGNGTLRSGLGFDEETYAKARPHFQKALEAYQAAGRTLLDLFKLLIEQFGSGVRPYLIHFAREGNLSLDLGNTATGVHDVHTATDSTQDDRITDSRQAAEPVPDAASKRETGRSGVADRSLVDADLREDVGRHHDPAAADGRGLRGEGPVHGDGQAQRVGSGDASGAGHPAGRDYRLNDDDFKREGSWRETAKRNLDIIALSKKIEAQGRAATPDEQAQLAKYTGWGASELAQNIFPVTPSWVSKDEFPVIYPQNAKSEYRELAQRAMDELTIDELREAASSTQYAHYTAAGIVRGIWSAMQHMGFHGGNMFEAGLGNGLFPMLMPDALHGATRYLGVERDILTARIAKLLLPEQSVRNEDFTRTKIPSTYFDGIVGNPPFANIAVTADRAYKKHKLLLHDYFLAKQIDALRPGGLMSVVVSAGTMNKLDAKAREYIADRADLVGAVRLPNNAFSQNAGTQVVTDVLFFQKREPGHDVKDTSWTQVGYLEMEVTPKRGGPMDVWDDQFGMWRSVYTHAGTPVKTRFAVNQYFLDHPEMVLGEQTSAGTMYSANEYTVESNGQDLLEQFNQATQKLPTNIYREADKSLKTFEHAAVKERDLSPAIKKEGAIYQDDSGNLRVVEGGTGVDVNELLTSGGKKPLTSKEVGWLKSYMGIKAALKESRFAQFTNSEDWSKKLKSLKAAYDKHVRKFGPVGDFRVQERKSKTEFDEDGNPEVTSFRVYKNKKLLSLDVESTLVEALERERDGKLVPSAGLLERTINKPVTPVIESASDALGLSLNELGRLDINHVAQLNKSSVQDVIKALGDSIYEIAPGEWQMADEYLSGDVVTKLDEASAMAATEPDRFNRNVAALLKVQPQPLAPTDITVTLGSGWVSPSYVEEFAADVLNANVDVSYSESIGTWSVVARGHASRRTRAARRETVNDWSVAGKRSADELLSDVLNSKTIKIMTPKTRDTPATLDTEATTAANELAKKMGERFKTWVWEDKDRAIALLDTYNSRFNRLAPRRFNGDHLTIPGLASNVKPYSHQKSVVWRAIQTGNVYAAHAVGAGKTMEMIMAGMEQKRLGLINKPMYVVPNHMLEQFSNEFQQLYPAAEIMVADDQKFHTQNRRRFIAQAAINAPDAIVITHSALEKLSLSVENQNAVIQEFIDALDEAMAMNEEDGRSPTRKRMEAQRERLVGKLKEVADSEGKDKNLTFEELGVDYLFVDEAHEFRKLDFATNRSNVKGIDPNGSAKAMDLYMKVRYLDRMRKGRSHFFASGTPITNTIGEMYTLMRFFMPEMMAEDGVSSFDAWSKQYGEVVAEGEPNAAAKIEIVERFARIVNVPELMKRFRTFADVLTSDQLGNLVKRPELKGGAPRMVEVEPSQALTSYMADVLTPRIAASKTWRPSPNEKSNPDPIINIITDGSLSTLDDRFYAPNTEPTSKGKIDVMVDNLIEDAKRFASITYVDGEGNDEPIQGGTQIVFSPIGLGAGVAQRGFDAYQYINDRLVKGGIKRGEIAWMRDLNSDAKKEKTFADMRSGRIKVLIGSPKNMGTGVNVQRRLKKLHFLAPPWFPSDVEQPHGRILRQGNQNPEVEIDWYVRTGTYDAAKWGMVARKDRFIKQALSGDDSIRTMEDISEESQYAQAAAIASGDQRQVELVKMEGNIQKLQRLKGAFYSAKARHQSSLASERATLDYVEKALEIAQDVAAKLSDDPKLSTFIIGGKTHKGVEAAAPGLLQAMQKAGIKDWHKLGEIEGLGELRTRSTKRLGDDSTFNVKYELHYAGSNERVRVADQFADATLTFGQKLDMTEDGLATRLVNVQKRVSAKLKELQQRQDEASRSIAKLEQEVSRKFPQERELVEAKAAYDALEAELVAESAADDAKASAGEPGRDAVQFSRGAAPVAPARGQSVDAVQGLVNGITSQWANAPEVVVVANMQDATVPQFVRDQDASQRSQGATGEPEGFWHAGKVYLVAGALEGKADVARVLLHEALGHYGLRGVFGEALTPILKQLATMRAGAVNAKATEYGLDARIEADRLQAAEEVLVAMSETMPEIGFVRRAIAAIRTWLREYVAAFKNLHWSDDEIISQFIKPAHDWVKRGVAGRQEQVPGSEIRFSRRADTPEQIRQFDIKHKTGNALKHYLGMSLQALGRRQLVDLYAGILPQLNNYNDLVQAMDAGKNDASAQADKLASDWGRLDRDTGVKGESDRLAQLMHEATLAEIDPEKPFETGINRLRWAGLRNKFNKLTPQAQDIYRRSRSMYEVHYAEVRKAMHERIQRSDLNDSQKGRMIASMDESFFKHVKGVYFPLARFGKYVVFARDEDGEVVSVMRAETINEAETAQAQLKKTYDGKGVTVSKITKDAEFNAARDAVSKGFVAELFRVLEGHDQGNVLRDAVSQLYLTSLPDLSWAKHGIHRKGMPGFSQDARRAFAQNMFHGARYLAKLKYADQLASELENMQSHIDAHVDDEGYDSIKAQQVLDEMYKRHDNLMSPKAHPVSTGLTSAGFVYYLGLSPAAAITNLSQTPLVALPIMGGRWGFGKSAKALLEASVVTTQARNDLSRSLKDDELRAFNRAVDDGTIDVTQAHDLAGISQGEDTRVVWSMRPIMRVASFLFHHAERFNRQATFLACYRLARETGVNENDAFTQARQTTYESHFDYSASNRPRIMQGNWAKVILLFKQYGQNMVYTLARQAYVSTKGLSPAERKQARKTLAGLLAMHAAGAGVLGLPLVGSLLAVASFLGGDDDDPWDAEVAMRNVLADVFGSTASDVIAHGLTRATPWDFSGRVALNRLILPDVREGLEGQDWAKEMMVASVGPVGGMVTSTAKGLQLVADGEYRHGLEAMLPLALRGPVTAMRYAQEGNIDRRTRIVVNDEVGAAGIVGQAFGVAPSEVRLATEGKWAIYQYDKARMDRRSTLVTAFAMAKMEGDNSGVRDAREAIQRFNELNPERRITARALAQSVRNRQARIQRADHGIYLPRKRGDATEQGRFAQ